MVMRECSLAVQRGVCYVHSCHQIRRYGGAGIAELNTTEAYACRTRDLFALPRLVSCEATVLMRGDGAFVQLCCPVGRMLCAQLRRQSAFAMALAIAELQAQMVLVPRAQAVCSVAACLDARS